jgi:hypothetical protein
MKSGKHHGYVDHPQKTGKMIGVFLLIWIGVIGFALWYFSWYSWDKHPIPLGICAFLLVAIFVTQSLSQKWAKSQRKTALGNILFFVGTAALMGCLEYIEFGGLYFWEAWERSSSQPPNNVIRFMHRTILLIAFLQIPIQTFYWRKAKQEEGSDKETGKEELLREAIARYNPVTMIADEPEVAAKPFPKHWIWVIGLYAAAIVALWCVGVLILNR